MKISEIRLTNYLHFKKELKLDLTYPKGHPKEGQALDKICFLGQSGTGKTTLLNLIKYFTCEDGEYDKKCFDEKKVVKDGVEIIYRFGDDIHFSKISTDTKYEFSGFDYSRKSPKRIDNMDHFIKKELESKLKDRTHILLNFPFCVVGPVNASQVKIEETGKGIVKLDTSKSELIDLTYINRKIWDFTPENIKLIWNIVFHKVSDYIKEYQTKEIELSKKIRETHIKQKDVVKRGKINDKHVRDFNKWEKQNPNPILELASKCLNKVLNNFSLEVETDIKKYPLESDSNERYIIIKSKSNGAEIEYPFLSTGTRQMMLTAIPLFYLQPKNTIILFDQPETSLYPNIQWELPEIYLNTAPNSNQFFFATHSPVVASSFEPWEIVELRFDENKGEVYRKEYFDEQKPRESSSYFINPRLLRWDSSYKMLFDLNRQGNEDRRVKLRELSIIEDKIKRGGLSVKKTEDLKEEYFKLANLLDWYTNA